MVFIRKKKFSNTNLLPSRHIKREKASVPVDMCRSKMSLLPISSRGEGGHIKVTRMLGGGGVYKSDEDARQKVKIHLVAIRTPNGASDQ